MALDRSSPSITVAVRVAFAGLGAAVAGPFGGALGAVVGHAFGPSATELVGTYIEKFGNEAARKLLDTGADSLIEKLKPSASNLESSYREALRLSLSQIRPQIAALMGLEFDDWFINWDACLKASVPFRLEEIQPSQLAGENLDHLFRRTMERLDAQGKALRLHNQSLILQTRLIPDLIVGELKTRLPEHFRENLGVLILQPNYEQAWKQADLVFRESMTAVLSRIEGQTQLLPQVAKDTAAILQELTSREIFDVKFLERYEDAVTKGRIAELKNQELEALTARYEEELRKLQEQVASRASEPVEAELSSLLEAGDLDAALDIKSRQVQARRDEAAKLPRDLDELGTIQELRFEWPQALQAYREAWQLGRDPDYGFKYARLAQTLNRFQEATAAYEALLEIYKDPEYRAPTLNNLGNLYSDTQRIQQAEEAYSEALDILRKLAETDPDAFLPHVATTLNNLANLYRDTQRIQQAEEAYDEALAIHRKLTEANRDPYLPDVATTLNNLGNLYRSTQRIQQAEEAYDETLAIRRMLAEANPDAYRPDVATTLNSLGNLYSDTQRIQQAEEAYDETLAIRRKLAEANPDAYRPDVAITLHNLAGLYSDTQRIQQAEEAYDETLAIRRELAEANPDAYLPRIATTLNNLAGLYSDTQRIQQAEEACDETLGIYRKLAEANPDAYRPRVAATLNNLANLYSDTQRIQQAEEAYDEALAIYRKLAEANPEAYLPGVATMLHNLARYCRSTERMEEAGTHMAEAERILNPFWQQNPELHGNLMARTLWECALVSEAREHTTAESCALARRAFAAAYDSSLKRSIQELIDRLCPEPVN